MRLSTQLKRFIAGLMIFTVNLGPIAPVAYSQSANVLEYDANGNLTKDHQNRCYEYNQANQLKRIYDCASTLITIAEYIYGPDGQRLKTVEYYNSGLGTETTYTPNRTTQHAKSTDSGVITWIEDTNYYYANQELVARQDTGGDTTYYHPDHLGSPNLQTNQTGAVVSRQDFSPYGRPNPARTNNLELNNRLQFTGQREDRSGLNYYGARYYSSETRSFTQPDPILPNPYDPQQLNRYAYVRNNPIKYVDPSGNVAFLSPIIDWGWTGKDLIAQQFIKWNPNSTDDERAAASKEQTFIIGAEITAILATGVDSMLPGDDIARVATKELMQREARQTLASVGGKGFSSFYKLKKHVGVAKRPDALHHIVEQHSDNIFRFGNEQIQNTKNVIKLPDSAGSIHKKITGFYNSIQPEITGSDALRVRDWVKNKSYVEQYNFGIDQIRRFGGEEYLINQGIGSIK